MIKRPENLLVRRMNLFFNLIEFDTIEIDIDHINQGKHQSRPINFPEVMMLNIIKALIHHEEMKPSEIKDFDDENCSYFVNEGFFNKKKFKIVFCACSDKPRTIGIIRLYRKRGKK